MKLRYLVGCVLVACATACGGSDTTRGPAGPTTFNTPPPAPPPPGEVTYTVLDGWTREPVAGAMVNANDEQTRTDAAGQVRLLTNPPCLRMQVVAPGFLERDTCALPEITLWPVANSDDRDATRIAAFGYGDNLTTNGREMPMGVVLGVNRSRADVWQAWRAAADEIRELTSGRIKFDLDAVQFVEGAILVTTGPAEACAKANASPAETFGYCWDPKYLGRRVHRSRRPGRRSGRGSSRARDRVDVPASGPGNLEHEPARPTVFDIRAKNVTNDRPASWTRHLARFRTVALIVVHRRRSIMRALTLGIVIVALVGASACQDTGVTSVPLPAPTTVSPSPPPPPPPPPPAPAAIAVLEMSNIKVVEYPPLPPLRQCYGYPVTFWLTEVTGLSGATIQGIVVSTTGQSEGTGQGCWRDVIRVEPGGTLDYFEREQQSLVYLRAGRRQSKSGVVCCHRSDLRGR